MKLTRDVLCRAGLWLGIFLAALTFGLLARAAAVSTTTVQGTVYLASGAPGSGTLQLSWPAFTTADNLAVTAGRTTVTIGADGFVSVNLAPNLGASPAGLFYTAVYHLSDGTTSTEYWVVPAAAQASLAAVRSQVMPAAQAVQAVSKAYVDNAVQSLAQGTLSPVGGTLTGPLYLNADPTQSLQAADKHYVDSAFSAAVPLSGATMVGALAGPSVTASLNKVLLVTAAPYNAKCDGVTDDQVAIQAAFNDAYNNGYSVEFPAGTCLTSTITIEGQSFFGHGKYVTTIVGQPGEDVFTTPDPSTNPIFLQSAHIHDLNIQVNASVDASASAAGGNNTFPYRVTGTAGGLTPLPQAPAPGPLVFGSGVNCDGQIIADSHGAFDEFYLPCANFTNLNAEFNGAHLAGQPIAIYNASGILLLATIITSAPDATHLMLAASATSAQSNVSGTYMNALTAPWYIGNCGFSFPMADGQKNGGSHGALNGWVFESIAIGQVATPLRQPNHTCAIFMQANNYAMNYEHVDTSMLYAGIIEALPYQNAAYVTWTPDTTKYLDVNLSHHILPLVTYNGTHRIIDGLSIYGGAWDSPQGTGVWMFSASTGTASGLPAYMGNASISRFYFECADYASGEVERFSGQSTTLTGGSTTQCGNGGNLGTWMTPAYLNWNVSDGSLDAQVGEYLQINGDHNTFTHTDLALGAVTDNGFENRVQAGINNSDASAKRAFYANLNMPQDPVGKLNGDFLLNGNSAAPFVSGSDLLTTCRDYRTLTSLCVNDPGGTELSRSYIHSPAISGNVSTISTGPVASWNALMSAGSRIPLTRIYVVAQGRCQGAASCSSTFYVRDRVTGSTIGSCSYTFGSSWTIQGGPSSNPCLINFASVPAGDSIGWDTNAWTATGLTAVDISFVGFQPQNSDVVGEVISSAQLAGVIQSGAAGVPVNITAANWQWGNAAGVLDGSSPVGYSTSLSNAWSLTAGNGSTNLNGGALYPAVPSTISYLVQAPAVITNSLATAMAAADTSLTLSVPATSSYASGGCFQIDQEIVCYSGALATGSTAVPISRGQYGTLAQAHASGATVSSVGTGVFYTACNSTNYAATNAVFGANWSYVSSPFAAQNCSGTKTTIQLAFANGPSGQTYKIAAVQIAQNSGNPQATGSNQVPISASAGNNQYSWTTTKSLAGSGTAIPTGPATSTSGNITTFAGGSGQIQDSGVPVGSLASLSSATLQSFAGSVAAPNINGIVYANPNASGTTTAGINEALDSFGSAPNCGTVILPLGTYNISSTIGGSHVSGRTGCILRGHGMTDAGVIAATQLKWAGTASGTMLDMLNCYYCRSEKFTLNGNGAAGVGHATEAENGASHLSFGNVVEDLSVQSIGGTPGIAYQLFSTSGVMVDQTTYKNVVAMSSAECFDLSGANTTDTQIYGQSSCNASTYGFNLGAGTGLAVDGVEFSQYGGGNASVIFNVAHQASVSASNIYSESFYQVLNAANGVTNTLDYGISIRNSAFNAPAWSSATLVNYTQNGVLDLTGTGIRSNLTSGAAISFNPVGTSGNGTVGLMNLTNATIGTYTTVSNGAASTGYGSIFSLGNSIGGPTGGRSWYPRDTIGGLNAALFDGQNIHVIGGASICFGDQSASANYLCEKAYQYGSATQLAWYQGATVVGGWNLQNSLTSGAFSAYDLVAFDALKNSSGQVLIKSSLNGYHGTNGTKVQYSDGTGTSGNLASYAGDGSVTDSGVKPYLTGTTGSIGGSSLAAGACASGTLAVANATTAMAVAVSPVTYPGDAYAWKAYVSASGTVTVKVCATVAGTPTASIYNVRVIQ